MLMSIEDRGVHFCLQSSYEALFVNSLSTHANAHHQCSGICGSCLRVRQYRTCVELELFPCSLFSICATLADSISLVAGDDQHLVA